ncbi:MAG: diacylglycerol kinase family lipid kinase [Candidatus Heimdallarchaeum endolithica]|uniref:Diacylglycerol kinase family lipid kinase n=1 Tax=Candidatus Heimdallarchaeum endolithica TaxID=2876572 RepID=A0A9Y1BRP3_9ARCH|nr:MAG: diacylglycerol kinase family lipid kinase [Candidatus Heimdallarchaeum endolithica]
MSYKWKFIINPNSGSQQCEKRWKEAEEVVKKQEIDYDVSFTSGPRQANILAEEAVKNGFNRIVVASGDGTLNEVVNGLMNLPTEQRKKVALGVLPFGTGNDYATTLGFPWNPKNAIDVLFNKSAVSPASIGKIHLVDTGYERYFINLLDAGISSEVGLGNKKGELKFIKSASRYTLLALKKLVTMKQRKAVVTIDDEKKYNVKLMLLIFGNGISLGGGMIGCPDAHPQKELFDFFLTENFTKLKTLKGLMTIFNGEHLKIKGGIYSTAKKIEVELEDAIPFVCDGELDIPESISTHLIGEIIPHAINVLYYKDHKSIKWLSREELDKGLRPLKNQYLISHSEFRKWQEKN